MKIANNITEPVSYTNLDVYKRQDYGRVLVGMQVPPGEMGEFKTFLKNLGYGHWDESQNPAYKLFLG